MTSEVISALIGASGMMAGTILGYWLQREAKKTATLKRFSFTRSRRGIELTRCRGRSVERIYG